MQGLISRKRLLQSTSNSARCVQQVQYTTNAACYLKSELASLRGNVWYHGNDCSDRPRTQRVVFSRSSPPLKQYVISIWACVTLMQGLISLTQLVVFRRSNDLLTQQLSQSELGITQRQGVISWKRLLQSTSNSARCVQESNPPLTQHVISIWACITPKKCLISRKRLLQSTSNSARRVQEVQCTSNAAVISIWALHRS